MPMDVTMPDGTIIRNVPDGTTKAQLQAKLAGVTKISEPKQVGLIEGIGQDYNKRTGEAKNSIALGLLGKETPLETAVGLGGAGGKFVVDTVGRGLTDMGRFVANNTPEIIKEPIREGAQYVANSPVGEGVKGAAQYVGGKLNEFSQENPREAKYFGNVAGIMGASPAAEGFMALNNAANKVVVSGVKAGAKGASKVGIKGLEKLATPKNILPNAEQLKEMGVASYKRASDTGEVFAPELGTGFARSIEAAKPAKIGGVVDSDVAVELERTLGKYKNLDGKRLTIDEIDIIDKDLSDIKGQAYSSGKNKLGEEIGNIQNSLRNSVSESPAGKALSEARDFYRKGFQMDDIERIFRNAEGRPNEANIIQTGFRNLANQARKKGSGYSKAQIKLMDKAAKGGMSIDALKLASSRLLTIGSGLGGGIAPAASAYMINQAAGAGATTLQAAKAGKVAKSIVGDLRVPADPSMLNKAAQNLLERVKAGQKITPKDLKDVPPRQINEIMKAKRIEPTINLKNTKK